MKYIFNPITRELDEIAKIGQEKILKKATAAHTDSLNKNYSPQVTAKLADSEILKKNINARPKRDILDYVDQQRHIYEGTPLSEKNKKINTTLAAANKKNNVVDPNRPTFSASDVIFASMGPSEAMRFTGGYDKEKIKFLREIKSRLHKQEAYDEEKKLKT